MDIHYYEVTSELDAREILRYLNELGIHNISGEVLKYFITDLKKLIKYDLTHKNLNNYEQYEVRGPERLHSASTFSSRTRSRVQDGIPLQCTRDCHKPQKNIPVRIVQSVPNLGQTKLVDKPLKRSCSCVRTAKKPESEEKSANSKSNIIKVAKLPAIKKCDPVTLYHYYTSLWNKYKSNVPGENDWSDLRWNIRQMMAGNEHRQIKTKMPESHRDKEHVTSKLVS